VPPRELETTAISTPIHSPKNRGSGIPKEGEATPFDDECPLGDQQLENSTSPRPDRAMRSRLFSTVPAAIWMAKLIDFAGFEKGSSCD
jgi:hypothetical protein